MVPGKPRVFNGIQAAGAPVAPGSLHGLWLSRGLLLLTLPLDASTGIDGLRRLYLALLLPHFLDPLPGQLVEGVILHWLDEQVFNKGPRCISPSGGRNRGNSRAAAPRAAPANCRPPAPRR